MKTVPQPPKESAETLYDLAHKAIRFHLLGAAIDLGAHDFFDTPHTAEAFSESVNGDAELIEKFLNALVAMDLLVKRDSLYVNSPVASTYLVSSKPFFQGVMLKHLERSMPSRWGNLAPRLIEGPLPPSEKGGAAFDKDVIRGIAQWGLAGGVPAAVNLTASLPEFSGARRLLDIGGGHGLYTIAFCQANPQLEGVVLDMPPVIEATKEFITQYDMNDRVTTIAGDYSEVDWDGQYDIIFAADVFFRAEEEMKPVVRKIGDSLNEGGVFVSKHQKMDPSRTSPAQTVLHDLMLFVMRPFPPHTYTREEFAALFQADDFDIETHDMDIPNSPSEMMICRKRGRRR